MLTMHLTELLGTYYHWTMIFKTIEPVIDKNNKSIIDVKNSMSQETLLKRFLTNFNRYLK